MRCGKEPKKSEYISIFPRDQTNGASYRFMGVQCVHEFSRDQKHLDFGHFTNHAHDAHGAAHVTFKFETKGLATLARNRILEEQKGGDWPSCAVVLATPWAKFDMIQMAEARTPGAAV